MTIGKSTSGAYTIKAKSGSINDNSEKKSKTTKTKTKMRNGRSVSPQKENKTKKSSFAEGVSKLVGKFKKAKKSDIDSRLVKKASVGTVLVNQQKVGVDEKNFGDKTKNALTQRNSNIESMEKEENHARSLMEEASVFNEKKSVASRCTSDLDILVKSVEGDDDELVKEMVKKINLLKADLEKHTNKNKDIYENKMVVVAESKDSVAKLKKLVVADGNHVKSAFESDKKAKISSLVKEKIDLAHQKSEGLDQAIKNKKDNATSKKSTNKFNIKKENQNIKDLYNNKAVVKTGISKALHEQKKTEKCLTDLNVLLSAMQNKSFESSQSEEVSKVLEKLSGDGEMLNLENGVDSFIEEISKNTGILKNKAKVTNKKRCAALSGAKALLKSDLEKSKNKLVELRKESAQLKKDNIAMLNEVEKNRSGLAEDLREMSEAIDKDLDEIDFDFLEQEAYLQTKIPDFETEKTTQTEMDKIKNETKMKVLGMSEVTKTKMPGAKKSSKKSVKKSVKNLLSRSVKKQTVEKPANKPPAS